MTFNIGRFNGEMNNSGIAQSGHFEVFISRPFGFGFNMSNIVEPIGLATRVDGIDLPGRALATIDNYYDVGVRRDIPYGAIYQDLPMSVICSEDLREKEFFEKWQDIVVGKHRNQHRMGKQYDIGYYDDYIADIEIIRYRPDGLPTYRLTLREAYPKIINPISMTWDSLDVLKLEVSLSYRFFTIDQATNKLMAGDVAKANELKPHPQIPFVGTAVPIFTTALRNSGGNINRLVNSQSLSVPPTNILDTFNF